MKTALSVTCRVDLEELLAPGSHMWSSPELNLEPEADLQMDVCARSAFSQAVCYVALFKQSMSNGVRCLRLEFMGEVRTEKVNLGAFRTVSVGRG